MLTYFLEPFWNFLLYRRTFKELHYTPESNLETSP